MTPREPEPDAPHPAPLRPQFKFTSKEERDWANLHEVPSESGWRTLRMRGMVYGTIREVVPLRVLPSLGKEFLQKIEAVRALAARSYAERESAGDVEEEGDDEDYEDEIDWEDDDDDEYDNGDTDDDDGSRNEQYDLLGYRSDKEYEEQESSEAELDHPAGGGPRDDNHISHNSSPYSTSAGAPSAISSSPHSLSPSLSPTASTQESDSPPLHPNPRTAFRIARSLAKTFAAGLYAPSTSDRADIASRLEPLMQHGYNANWSFSKRDIVEKPLPYAFEGARKMDRVFFFCWGMGRWGCVPWERG